jgi:hypothetical protein
MTRCDSKTTESIPRFKYFPIITTSHDVWGTYMLLSNLDDNRGLIRNETLRYVGFERTEGHLDFLTKSINTRLQVFGDIL